MGRPSKLTDKFKRVAEKVIQADIDAVILTDEELLFLINDELVDDERVASRTFQDWKSNSKDSEFMRLIKKAKISQKRNLIGKLMTEDKNWQRFAWMLERKFSDEYNLKQVSEVTHKVEPITVIINLDK